MDEPNVPYSVVLVNNFQPLKCKLTSLWTAWFAPNNANWEKIGRSRCLSPSLCDMRWTSRSPACRWPGLCVHTLIHLNVSKNYLQLILTTICQSPPSPPLRVLVVLINSNRCISIHITKSKIHISYLKNHDSTLMLSSMIFTCYLFQHSSISLLRVYFFSQFSFRCY